MQCPVSPSVQKYYRDRLQVPGAPAFIDTDTPIVPVIAVEQLGTLVREIKFIAVNGNGSYTVVFDVPAGKKWRLINIFSSYATTTGTTTASNFLHYVSPQGTANTTVVDDSAQSIKADLFLPARWFTNLGDQNILLLPGSRVRSDMVITFTAGGTGNEFLTILYEEFEV